LLAARSTRTSMRSGVAFSVTRPSSSHG
jgi:hypothetical protein